jgi:hypothetical protein
VEGWEARRGLSLSARDDAEPTGASFGTSFSKGRRRAFAINCACAPRAELIADPDLHLCTHLKRLPYDARNRVLDCLAQGILDFVLESVFGDRHLRDSMERTF